MKIEVLVAGFALNVNIVGIFCLLLHAGAFEEIQLGSIAKGRIFSSLGMALFVHLLLVLI